MLFSATYTINSNEINTTNYRSFHMATIAVTMSIKNASIVRPKYLSLNKCLLSKNYVKVNSRKRICGGYIEVCSKK